MAEPKGKLSVPKVPKYIIAAVATIVGLFLLWYFRSVAVYIIISAVIGIVGKPLVDTLRKVRIGKFRIPQWLAALTALVAVCGVAVAFFWIFIPLISGKLSELSNLDIQGFLASLDEPIKRIEEFAGKYFAADSSEFSLQGEISAFIMKTFNSGAAANLFSSVISTAANLIAALFSIVFMAFFFLKDNTLFLRILLAVTPTRYENNIKHALSSATKLLSRYLIGIICESTVMMLLVATGLMLWGFSASDAFFMGIVVGILNVIPYVGPWLGFGLCFLIGIAMPPAGFTTLTVFFATGVSVIVAQSIDNILLQPIIYSNSVKAHPLEIFIVLLMAGHLGGILGMVLAIPAYTVLRVIAREFFSHFKIVQKLTENMEQ